MNQERLKHGISILEELTNLEKYKSFKNSGTTHFELRKHYSKCEDYETILIPRKYNDLFFSVIEKILSDLEKEIEKLIIKNKKL